MKDKYYTILLAFLPVIFICAKILVVISIDKKLAYRNFDIKYRDISPISKNVGIQKYFTRGGTCIAFETESNLKFERRYLGFIQQILCHFHYSNLIEKKEQSIGLYMNPDNSSKREIPFISLGRTDKKDFWYYLDIYAYAKKKYSVIFILSYLILFLILFSICINRHLIEPQKKLWIIALAVPVLYMFI